MPFLVDRDLRLRVQTVPTQAALVLKGAHATEFPVGKYSDLSEGVDADTLDSWTQVKRASPIERRLITARYAWRLPFFARFPF